MKRIACFLIALSIMISIFAPLSFAEVHPKYYTVPVEYSDNIGHPESLDVMIQDDHVYVDAKMIADRLGYTFGENDERAVIFNKDTTNGLPVSITQFDYNSTRVSHMLFNKMLDTYEAPFMSIKNDEGSWIPLEYGLLLMNSGMVITNDTIRIDTPTKNIVDYFLDIAKNAEIYSFDWADDFGYTDTVTAIKGASSHIVNVFNGVLECNGTSWASLFQQFVGSSDSYDGKYGEDLALLLCTESENELQAASEKVELMCDLLDADGDLGGLLSFTSKMLDFNVGSLYKQCETVLDAVRDGNADAVRYSRSYQALEAALDKQTWFSHTGGNLLEVQKGVSNTVGDTFKVLNIAMKIAEIVGYVREFQNQDDFSLEALTHYLDTADKGLELPSQMKQSMINYSDALAGTVAGYTSKRFLDHADEWVTDAVKNKLPLHQVLGAQAAAALIAWNIVSKTVPLIANGLSSADNYELALYSQVFQGDAFLNYLEKRNAVFSDAENITAENLYEVAQYCFIYLKTCCVTREAALASLENYLSSTKEEIQPLIDYQNSINEEIAGILVELKAANATNDNCSFGFLVSDNREYLNKYDDSRLIQWIESTGIIENDSIDLQSIWNEYLQKTQEKSAYFFVDDFDGNGTQEAFGITGIFDGEMIYNNVKIYYIDSSGKLSCIRKTTQYGDSLYGYLFEQWSESTNSYSDLLLSTSTSKFIVWEISAYGSGSLSIILGVKNGEAYEPAISEQYMSFGKKASGEYEGLTSDFSNGYHDYIESVFDFDDQTGQFVLK